MPLRNRRVTRSIGMGAVRRLDPDTSTRKVRRTAPWIAICLASVSILYGQQGGAPPPASTIPPASASASGGSVVPRLITFNGALKDNGGKAITGTVTLTLSLYTSQEGGPPLWVETQTVQADDQGHYSLLLGATLPNGLPLDLFTSGEAQWLGVQPQLPGAVEQPRVLLVGMPYALKASDADTLGGLPASAFVQAAAAEPSAVKADAAQSNSLQLGAQTASQDSNGPLSLTGSGTTDFLPLWTNSGTLGNSALFQSGTGSTAKVGLNTATPASTLDVNGTGTVRGTLTLPATGTATSSSGRNSQPASLQASSFNSSTNAAVNQTFNLQAEPTGNNTTNPSGKLNLLFASGNGTPAETGLSIAGNGKITFATGQTFPGTGTITGVTTASGSGLTGGGTTGTLTLGLQKTCATNQVLQWSGTSWVCATMGTGTITGVTAGSGLTGGGSSGTVTLSVPSAGITNAMLQHSSVTLTPGSGMAGGGAVALGSSTTLGLQNCGSNQILQYIGTTWTCANAATGTIAGVTAGTDLTGGGTSGTVTLNLDTTKVPILAASSNIFSGILSASAVGIGTTFPSATLEVNGTAQFDQGMQTLGNIGVNNFAPSFPLDVYSNPTSAETVRVLTAGTDAAISLNNTGFAGREYWIDSGAGGAGVGAGNLAIWDNTAKAARLAVNPSGYVGLGTTNPYTLLHLVQYNPGGLGPSLTLMNNAAGAGAGGSVDFDGYDTATYPPTARIQSLDDGFYSSNLTFSTKTPGAANNSLVEQARITDYGSLVVDASSNNALALGGGSASGTGLLFGGPGSGEGIASCRASYSTCTDGGGSPHQYGLDFYTGYTRRMWIDSLGNVGVAGCTFWQNGDSQGLCLSDARLKTNIHPFPQVLDKLAQLEPVHFNWNPSNPPEYRRGTALQTGLIAQQVEPLFPDMVTMGEDGYRRVNYGQLPYLLLQGVRELKARNDSLRAEAEGQRKQIEEARAEVAKLRGSAAATDARIARLDRSSAAKDAQIATLSSEVEQLRRTQQQMAGLLARFARSQGGGGKIATEWARAAAKSLPAQLGEIARKQF